MCRAGHRFTRQHNLMNLEPRVGSTQHAVFIQDLEKSRQVNARYDAILPIYVN